MSAVYPSNAPETLQAKRDRKVREHLQQYAPVWLVDEKLIPSDEAVQFNVVFQHNQYNWINRRYRYDGFNDVLYFKGQRIIPESEAIDIQVKDPYIAATVSDIPNSYGG